MLKLPRYGQYRDKEGASGCSEAVGPDVVFLSESHLNKARVEKLRRKLKMDHVAVVESVGARGGLILFWHNPVVIKVLSKTKNFIDATMGAVAEGKWRITGFYGEPR